MNDYDEGKGKRLNGLFGDHTRIIEGLIGGPKWLSGIAGLVNGPAGALPPPIASGGENILKAQTDPALGQAEDAANAKLQTSLVDILAKCEAKLKQAEDDLAREREARIKAEDAFKRKTGDKATIARLNKLLESWKKAPAWMITALLAVAQDGPKARSRGELWPFVEAAGGPSKCRYNAQFEIWRAALPDDFCDKTDRAKTSIPK